MHGTASHCAFDAARNCGEGIEQKTIERLRRLHDTANAAGRRLGHWTIEDAPGIVSMQVV
jgi:hypothetical protein